MKKYIPVILLLMVIALPLWSMAQPGLGTDDVDDTPIDGGLSLLLAAGVGYGAGKLRNKKTNIHA